MNSSPERQRQPKPQRVFTPEEANAILPHVRELVTWFRETLKTIHDLQVRIGVLEMIGAKSPSSPEHREHDEAQRRLERTFDDYGSRIAEFQQIGCLIKDVEEGLVDFYSRRDGRLVFLCWRLGEERVQHWHEIQAGVKGRRPLGEA